MSDGPVFVERIDYEAAVAWYMENDDGTEDALVNAINVALVGVREAQEELRTECLRCGKVEGKHQPVEMVERRFVTEWEEVET